MEKKSHAQTNDKKDKAKKNKYVVPLKNNRLSLEYDFHNFFLMVKTAGESPTDILEIYKIYK
jgi:hypothetical protein